MLNQITLHGRAASSSTVVVSTCFGDCNTDHLSDWLRQLRGVAAGGWTGPVVIVMAAQNATRVLGVATALLLDASPTTAPTRFLELPELSRFQMLLYISQNTWPLRNTAQWLASTEVGDVGLVRWPKRHSSEKMWFTNLVVLRRTPGAIACLRDWRAAVAKAPAGRVSFSQGDASPRCSVTPLPSPVLRWNLRWEVEEVELRSLLQQPSAEAMWLAWAERKGGRAYFVHADGVDVHTMVAGAKRAGKRGGEGEGGGPQDGRGGVGAARGVGQLVRSQWLRSDEQPGAPELVVHLNYSTRGQDAFVQGGSMYLLAGRFSEVVQRVKLQAVPPAAPPAGRVDATTPFTTATTTVSTANTPVAEPTPETAETAFPLVGIPLSTVASPGARAHARVSVKTYVRHADTSRLLDMNHVQSVLLPAVAGEATLQ